MSIGVKKLLKIWIGVLACLFMNSPGFFATEAPDIAIMGEIPELVFTPKLTISPDTLKFCRLTMYTIPMDLFSDDKDRNLASPIPIAPVTEMPVNPHPLQFFSNRELLKAYFGGRNVVITQDGTTRHVMVVTGMGPKYDSLKKAEIEGRIRTSVVDIIDVLPEITEVQRTEIRNFFIHHRNILELLSVLSRDINENSFQQIQDLMSEDITIKEIMERSEAITNFKEVLLGDTSAILAKANFTSEIVHLNSILESREVQDQSVNFINRLVGLVQSHTAKQKETALAELRKILIKIRTEPEYCRELVYQVTALDEGTISSSLTGLKLIDPVERGHQQALGDLFHSEPLYLLWKTAHPTAPRYFFTQRDMCTACDPHICQSMLLSTEEAPPFCVLSAKAGNAIGAASVDFIQQMPRAGMIPLQDLAAHTIYGIYGSEFKKLTIKQLQRRKDDAKVRKLLDVQLSKIHRYRLPYLYLGDGGDDPQ